MTISDVQNYSWVISFSGLIIVFIGWHVVYRNAKKIATRAESKSLVDQIIKLLNETCDLSVKYWTDSGDNDHKKQSVRFNIAVGAKITQLSDFISFLKNREVEVDYELLASFSSSATLDSEKKKELTDDECTEKCQNCVNEAMALVKHIYEEFEKRHPPQKIKLRYDYYLGTFHSHCEFCHLPYERND